MHTYIHKYTYVYVMYMYIYRHLHLSMYIWYTVEKVNLLQLCIWMECRHGHTYVGVVGIALSGDEHNLGNVRVSHTADTFVSLNFDT